jgi:hypothetical protein
MAKVIGFMVSMWFTTSWELMLGVGIAHIHWWHSLPPMGFTTALILGFLFDSMLTGGAAMTYAFGKGWIK